MNIFRNQYANGTNGWFETNQQAWSNANAQDDPHSLKQIAKEIRITSKYKLLELLRVLENEKRD